MSRISIFSSLSTIQVLFFTLFSGTHVGTDYRGNKYYRGRPRRGRKRERRWVLYAGDIDASQVPPVWHGWLHHQTDIVPDEKMLRQKHWQKDATPNMTGTAAAYLPPGHSLKGGQRDVATGDYEAWVPPQ